MMLRSLAMAAAVATIPLTASAVIFDDDNNIEPGDNVAIAGAPYFFDATFNDADEGGMFSFTFTNSGASSESIVVSAGTVLQQTLEFVGGVTASFVGGDSVTVGQGQTTGVFEITSIIPAGGSDTLQLLFGDPRELRANGRGNIDFSVVGQTGVVPLPASILMLAGALCGLALISRRRSS